MNQAPEKRRLWQSLTLITLVALGLRLLAIRFFYGTTWNDYDDHLMFGFETGRIARSIAEGHGFSNPVSVTTGPTAWLTPVYPYLLAGIFKLFGVYTITSAFVMLGLNGLFSSLVCIPLYRIAERSFGLGTAVTASWIWAVYPYFIYLPSSFVWDTCLASLLATTLFLWALHLRERPSISEWFAFGAFCGLAALTNASTLVIAAVLSAYALHPLWRSGKKWLQPAGILAAGLILVLLPWEIRNYRTFHAPVPLRSVFWLQFWVGNDGDTSSWIDTEVHPSTNSEERAAFVRLGEIPYMREKRREALSFLAKHPGLYVVQCLRRFVYTWTGFWNLDPTNLQDEFHGFANVYLTLSLTLSMLLGIWRAWRNTSVLGEGPIPVFRSSRGSVLPYLLVLSCYPLVFYLTAPTIRYRHVMDPEIVVLAALGIRSLWRSPASSV